jgi:hypothetical protein
MTGLGDLVAIRCSTCGYGLTARKFAVPKECPICRTSLDPDAPLPDARAEDAPQNGERSHAEEPEQKDAAQSQFNAAQTRLDTVQIQFDAAETQLDAAQVQGDALVQNDGAQNEVADAPSQSDDAAKTDGEIEVKSFSETASQPPSETLNVPPGAVTSPLGLNTQPIPDADASEPRTESDDDEALTQQSAASRPAPRSGYETRAFTPPAPVSYETSPPINFDTSPSPTSAPPKPVQPLQPKATHATGSLESRVSPEVVGRYADAYRVARATVLIGTLIKVVGVLLGLTVGAGLFALFAWQGRQFGGNTAPLGFFVGLLTGVATFAFFFVLGTVVSAQGQLIKATLDGAVNSSPFLTNEQRAEAMSLR